MINRIPKILCVDDEQINLDLLEAMLQPHGYQVIMANNGPQALDIICNERIDIVLLDVMMAEMDGFEVCRRIKSDERLRTIPVIMLTAYAARERRISGIEAGAEDFLSKPLDRGEVLARVTMLLKVKALNDQLDSAYHSITSLTGFGEQLTAEFEPLNFNFMENIQKIVNHIIAVNAEESDHPQKILVGIHEADGSYIYRCFSYDGNLLNMTIAPPSIFSCLKSLATGSEMIFLNQSDLLEQHQELATELTAVVERPANLICHISHRIIFCALNYGRQVTRYDAEVINSVVAQSLFLKSLAQQVRETDDAFAYTIHALARAAEANDEDTGNHIIRVGEFSAMLAQKIGMPELFINLIRHQSIMHDVGKIHIPPSILKKSGALSSDEFELVKGHTTQGAAIIGDHIRLTLARSIALSHHERFDGSGYPYGLHGEQIPIEGRIVNLADQYDALRNSRCYKAALDHETSFRIITEGDGRSMPHHFDPVVLAAFKDLQHQFAEVFDALQQYPKS